MPAASRPDDSGECRCWRHPISRSGCDRVGIIDHGRLVAEGTRRELVAERGERDRITLTAAGGPELSDVLTVRDAAHDAQARRMVGAWRSGHATFASGMTLNSGCTEMHLESLVRDPATAQEHQRAT